MLMHSLLIYIFKMLKTSRVSEEERRVIWCVANQNNFLVVIQILIFMTLFGFVMYYFDKVFSAPLQARRRPEYLRPSPNIVKTFAVDTFNKSASG